MLFLRSGNPQLALPLLQKVSEVAGVRSSHHRRLLLLFPPTPSPLLLHRYIPAAAQTCAPSPPALSGVGGGALINLGIAYKNLRRYDDALRTYAKVICEAGGGDRETLQPLQRHTNALL
jgi:hypothetical protein